MTRSFDFNKALAELQSGKRLTGEDVLHHALSSQPKQL